MTDKHPDPVVRNLLAERDALAQQLQEARAERDALREQLQKTEAEKQTLLDRAFGQARPPLQESSDE